MTKVITYGTYDLLHYGHIRLLERAKALGDYLIVGVTADDFDKVRGKINVQQSLMERVEAVRATGIADEIIIEEYEGQKIDDIKRYGVDIFTVGSDWKGKFDYLNDYCKVIYLERTQGVSSTEIRSENRKIRLGLVGDGMKVVKFAQETGFANGITLTGVCSEQWQYTSAINVPRFEFVDLLEATDALYIASDPRKHYAQAKKALLASKHVLCESPVALTTAQYDELLEIAKANGCILMEAIKTAYSTAYNRLMLMLKSGKIGELVCIDATCTSLRSLEVIGLYWNNMCEWGPTALLPVLQLFGTEYEECSIISRCDKTIPDVDLFSMINLRYKHGVASVKIGSAVKAEGDMVISGTKGYAYIPSPWWKTDYFEIRYEDQSDNKRYFYQLDGEGIRYEIVSFTKAIQKKKNYGTIDEHTTRSICSIMNQFSEGDVFYI